MVQAYDKMFDTERFAYVIYTENYGIEFDSLPGESMDFVLGIFESRCREAIFSDDRTLSVENFQITPIDKESIVVSMTINTIHGIIPYRRELRF
jgi:hypothetical protein